MAAVIEHEVPASAWIQDGNTLVRRFARPDAITVKVFREGTGYRWSIVGLLPAKQVLLSPRLYWTEAEACRAALRELAQHTGTASPSGCFAS